MCIRGYLLKEKIIRVHPLGPLRPPIGIPASIRWDPCVHRWDSCIHPLGLLHPPVCTTASTSSDTCVHLLRPLRPTAGTPASTRWELCVHPLGPLCQPFGTPASIRWDPCVYLLGPLRPPVRTPAATPASTRWNRDLDRASIGDLSVISTFESLGPQRNSDLCVDPL